jgi:hypothetical protein
MATYREIHGKAIKSLSTDPSDDYVAGQIWYNTASDTFKTVLSSAAWVSSSNLNQSVYDNTGAGTQTAALNVGGTESPSVARSDNTEEYNGSGWATSGNLNTGRFGLGGLGTQTAAIVAGGNTSPGGGTTAATESYNGSVWTSLSSPSNLNTPRQLMNAASMGTSTAGLMVGGTPPTTGASEEWGGSAWTNGGTMSTARYSAAAMGTQTAALAAGGETPYKADVEEYNGSSWTTKTSMPTTTANAYRVGNSTTDLYVAGGYTPSATTTTHKWDGTSWTTAGAMGRTAAGSGGSPGSSSPTAGVAFGGSAPPPSISTTEEFNVSSNAFTAAAWASGGTVPYTSRQNMSFGTQTAAINAGGYVSTTLSTAASYDGTNWTSSPSLNVAARMGGVAGTQAAGLQFGGIQPPGTYNTNVQTWNGSAWSNNPLNLSVGTYGLMGCGTQTAALKVGGENPGGGNYTSSEEYDGEGWTAGGALPEAKYVGAGNGIQTSALITGGSPSGTTTFEYNGSSWTAGGALSTSRPGTQAGSAGATSDSNIVFGGGPALTVTEGYDGTAWSTRPSLGTGRGSTNGNGIATAGLMVSGGPPSGTTTATEEFTGETTSANVKTLTQS